MSAQGARLSIALDFRRTKRRIEGVALTIWGERKLLRFTFHSPSVDCFQLHALALGVEFLLHQFGLVRVFDCTIEAEL